MSVNIALCENKKHFRDFLDVPFNLHKNTPNWVPPLRQTTKQILDKKNPLYKNSEIKLWIAYVNKKPVGRIAGIVNRLHNKFHDENIGFWGFFEADNSDEIASALFQHVEQWTLAQGLSALRGPMSPSINYECGLQISAFDTKPFIMMPQNPEYYPTLVERQGYKKIKDLEAWCLEKNDLKINPRKERLVKILQKKYHVNLRPINMSDLKNEMQLIATIYNDAWEKNWGYLPLDLDELNYLVSSLKYLLLPNFIHIAEIAGEPCGFSVCLADLNQVLLTLRNGKLLPINFLKLIWKIKIKKSITQMRIPLLGVLKKYQHLPIGAMLYCTFLESVPNSGILRGEFSWILENNEAMKAGLKFVNASHYKSYRIYEKSYFTEMNPSMQQPMFI